MQFEDYDDDDEGEEESDYPLPSGSLSTPSTPNFLNFWMQPDSAFLSAGAATDRAVTIDAKVYILGETVPKRRAFAEKEVNICEVTNEATVEACSAVVEEWPVEEEPAGATVPVAVAKPSAFIEPIPTVISIPTSAPLPTVMAKKLSVTPSRKPLANVKPNLPSFRVTLSNLSKAASSKINTPKTPSTKVSTPNKARTRTAPSTAAKPPRTSSIRTILKAATPTSTTLTMKKSGSLPLSSRSLSSTSTSASTPKAAKKMDNLSPHPTISSIRLGRSLSSTHSPKGTTISPLRVTSASSRAIPAWR
ncbi:hypothetical protein HGRIS_003624 [Hohenbuehelia grisea]